MSTSSNDRNKLSYFFIEKSVLIVEIKYQNHILPSNIDL